MKTSIAVLIWLSVQEMMAAGTGWRAQCLTGPRVGETVLNWVEGTVPDRPEGG